MRLELVWQESLLSRSERMVSFANLEVRKLSFFGWISVGLPSKPKMHVFCLATCLSFLHYIRKCTFMLFSMSSILMHKTFIDSHVHVCNDFEMHICVCKVFYWMGLTKGNWTMLAKYRLHSRLFVVLTICGRDWFRLPQWLVMWWIVSQRRDYIEWGLICCWNVENPRSIWLYLVLKSL